MNEFMLEENFYIFESVRKKLQELKRILECYTKKLVNIQPFCALKKD